MKIILLGPPGAGKGTQAKTLASKLNVAHIATGDLLRQNVAKDTDLGKQAKDFMNKGALVPDELVTQMISLRMQEADIEKGFILDGYPRNINQAESLDKILKDRGSEIDSVIYLDASEPVIIQRLTGRLVCSQCGANFHIKNMPPKVAMVCDNCQAKLFQRTDDRAETIKKRLEVYLQESHPLIEYYKKKGKLKRVSSDEDAGIVLDKMLKLLNREQ
ncbi:MAG: adenylate kinase [Candidatus Omnitrophota bacterium]|nr:MAG: adenylate kinase [Candidatus Omnitrophota bacterium]